MKKVLVIGLLILLPALTLTAEGVVSGKALIAFHTDISGASEDWTWYYFDIQMEFEGTDVYVTEVYDGFGEIVFGGEVYDLTSWTAQYPSGYVLFSPEKEPEYIPYLPSYRVMELAHDYFGDIMMMDDGMDDYGLEEVE